MVVAGFLSLIIAKLSCNKFGFAVAGVVKIGIYGWLKLTIWNLE